MFSQISISIFHFKVKKKVKKEHGQKEPVHESERKKGIPVPRFKLGDDIDEWISRIVIWRSNTDVIESMHGYVICEALGDLGQKILSYLTDDELISSNNLDLIIEGLQKLSSEATNKSILKLEQVSRDCNYYQ